MSIVCATGSQLHCRSSKPAPVITQEHTTSLEDVIRRRIKEEKYDDVSAPQAKDTRRVATEVELSQEKSRQGLGEVCRC